VALEALARIWRTWGKRGVHPDGGLLDGHVSTIGGKLLGGRQLSRDEAFTLAALPAEKTVDILFLANLVRRKTFADAVEFCAIVNAKSGRCSQDCRFCAQSSMYRTQVRSYPLAGAEKLMKAVAEKAKLGCRSVGLVTSGRRLSDAEFDTICRAAELICARLEVSLCVSIGAIDAARARALRQVGVTRVHHNLEASARHFPNLCTTHSYAERVESVQAAKENGLAVCCGGIFATGESMADRLELAFALRDLGVDRAPLNVLRPIEGTPLADCPPLSPMEILRTIALFRLVLPTTPIIIAGGREHNLRDLQSWAFHAGATGLMIGDYLTTRGRRVPEDAQMIHDLRLALGAREASLVSEAR